MDPCKHIYDKVRSNLTHFSIIAFLLDHLLMLDCLGWSWELLHVTSLLALLKFAQLLKMIILNYIEKDKFDT